MSEVVCKQAETILNLKVTQQTLCKGYEAKQSNGGIDRARTQPRYAQVLDEKPADSRSGPMTCWASSRRWSKHLFDNSVNVVRRQIDLAQQSFEFCNITPFHGIGELLKQTSGRQPFLDGHFISFLLG
jgi:hypothetical protein